MAHTRLGINLGSGSLGWCLYDLNADGSPSSIRAMGVRIFSDGLNPRSGAPLAANRRRARAARRRRDRYLRRRTVLLQALAGFGLLPVDPSAARDLVVLDPYVLRKRALDAKLDLHEIGRLLFHINQRRGIVLGRKERNHRDTIADHGMISEAVTALDEAMHEQGARTYGEFLSGLSSRRARPLADRDGYAFFPHRRHLEAEFDAVWAAQARHYPDVMTEGAGDRLRRIIFYQRPLAPAAVGRCAVFNAEPRLHKAHPLFQECRLYENVSQLEVVGAEGRARRLTFQERDTVVRALRRTKSLTLKRIGKQLKLADGEALNSNGTGQRDLEGDAVFAAFQHPSCFAERWEALEAQAQWMIIREVADEDDGDRLSDWLRTTFGLSDIQAQAIGAIVPPAGYGRLGETATRLFLGALMTGRIDDRPMNREEAFDLAFRHEQPDAMTQYAPCGMLPYYGEILSRHITPGTLDADDDDEKRWGRISAPSVHIALNQLRKVVNAIIAVHGLPDRVVIELTRDLQQTEQTKARHAKAFRRAIQASRAHTETLVDLGQPDTGANRALLKMWENLEPADPLARCCPFCGVAITPNQLFGGEVRVAHVVPYSRSLDDSNANRTIAHQQCRIDKGSMTPWESWGKEPDRWAITTGLAARKTVPERWRFGAQAMERYERDGDVVTRHMTNTHFLARLARLYLGSLYRVEDAVAAISGYQTALLRRMWGLNRLLPDHTFVPNPDSTAPRNRLDLRHHAIDAAIAGYMTPAFVDALARSARRAEHLNRPGHFDALPQPWDDFREEFQKALDGIVVSHKADHGRSARPSRHRDATAARLHNDTAYGLTGLTSASGLPVVVHRVSLSSLSPADIADPGRIPDAALRAALQTVTRGRSGKEFSRALTYFAASDPLFKGIRHVRVRTGLNVIEIRDSKGKVYKGFKGDANAWLEIWGLPDGKWTASIVSQFAAHSHDFIPVRPHPAAKKMMTLRQNDILAIERSPGEREICRVVKIRSNGQVTLAGHHEGGSLKERDAMPGDPFKYLSPSANGLKKLFARQIRVDELGRVSDPGGRNG